jgi:hypothetical protein
MLESAVAEGAVVVSVISFMKQVKGPGPVRVTQSYCDDFRCVWHVSKGRTTAGRRSGASPLMAARAPARRRVDDAWRALLEDLTDPGAWRLATGQLRRRQGAGRGDRVLVSGQPAPALGGPGLPEPHRQGAGPRPRPGAAGLLGGFRPGPGRGRGAVAEARWRAKRSSPRGRRCTPRRSPASRTTSTPWVLALIPILGGLVWFAAVVFGLGVLVVAIWRGRSAARAASAAA